MKIKVADVETIKKNSFNRGYASGKRDTIEKALKWLLERVDVTTPIPTNDKGEPLADGYANYLKERQNVINQVKSEFRKAMEE